MGGQACGLCYETAYLLSGGMIFGVDFGKVEAFWNSRYVPTYSEMDPNQKIQTDGDGSADVRNTRMQVPVYDRRNGSKTSIRANGDGSCVDENTKIQDKIQNKNNDCVALAVVGFRKKKRSNLRGVIVWLLQLMGQSVDEKMSTTFSFELRKFKLLGINFETHDSSPKDNQ